MRGRIQPVVYVPWWLIGVGCLLLFPIALLGLAVYAACWAAIGLAALIGLVTRRRRRNPDEWLTEHGRRCAWPEEDR